MGCNKRIRKAAPEPWLLLHCGPDAGWHCLPQKRRDVRHALVRLGRAPGVQVPDVWNTAPLIQPDTHALSAQDVGHAGGIIVQDFLFHDLDQHRWRAVEPSVDRAGDRVCRIRAREIISRTRDLL